LYIKLFPDFFPLLLSQSLNRMPSLYTLESFMKLKYCASCGSLDITVFSSGMANCLSCKSTNSPKEGGMDEINAFRTERRRYSNANGDSSMPASILDASLKQKPPSFQSTPEEAIASKPSPAPPQNDIKERLKRLSNSGDFEIM
jgi:hypothetical protein